MASEICLGDFESVDNTASGTLLWSFTTNGSDYFIVTIMTLPSYHAALFSVFVYFLQGAFETLLKTC